MNFTWQRKQTGGADESLRGVGGRLKFELSHGGLLRKVQDEIVLLLFLLSDGWRSQLAAKFGMKSKKTDVSSLS